MIRSTMLKGALNVALDAVFVRLAAYVFFFFDRYLLHRLNFARGRASLWSVRHKGVDVLIHGYCKIISPEKLVIGDYVRIGTGCYLNCMGGVTIGRNSQLSRNIVIYSSAHDYEGAGIPYDDSYVLKSVDIGESVWIGMGVSILPGVSIGDGAIVGMGAVISKDVPPYAIVVGAPQRVVKYRSSEKFDVLNLEKKWFGKMFPDN